ncbi:GGDEF domain-containing protein [uncultured Pseudomonas sp.]|uniref:GGDEF domain-containing protein n=1 Tax=uncultured Pseudomonas sp. TaxID=114707 RepID=UPI0025EEE1D2|nr:GGDEF domain-containing protein [uncultured Pseudomonas sp.]
MLLSDPFSLLLVLTPFGVMTALLLCLSYVGPGRSSKALHWWLLGELFNTSYRLSEMLQPGLLVPQLHWLEILSPRAALLASTGLLIASIGCHTVALLHFTGAAGSRARQARLLLILPLLYLSIALMLLDTAYIVPWFAGIAALGIALQMRPCLGLLRRYRGAWGIFATQLFAFGFQAWSCVSLLVEPLGPLPFDEPDMPSRMALLVDFMVSFLLTLGFALMLQEHLRLQAVQLSITDVLTGALNRRGAQSILDQQWKQALLGHCPMAVAMIDLDNFKRINDQYGHAVGDSALQVFAATVFALKRHSDVFVRWGGEEFLLLLPNTDIQQAQAFMQRLREALSSRQLDARLPLRLAFSAGLTQTGRSPAPQSFDALLRSVDHALYRAKVQRDCVELVGEAD